MMKPVREEFTLIHGETFTNEKGREFDAFGVCYDLNKHSNAVGVTPTGLSLYINNTDYAVVDVDIHCENENEKDAISEDFEDALKTVNVKLVEFPLK